MAGEVAADPASLLWLGLMNSCQVNLTVTEFDGFNHLGVGGAKHPVQGAGHPVHGDGGASHHNAGGEELIIITPEPEELVLWSTGMGELVFMPPEAEECALVPIGEEDEQVTVLALTKVWAATHVCVAALEASSSRLASGSSSLVPVSLLRLAILSFILAPTTQWASSML